MKSAVLGLIALGFGAVGTVKATAPAGEPEAELELDDFQPKAPASLTDTADPNVESVCITADLAEDILRRQDELAEREEALALRSDELAQARATLAISAEALGLMESIKALTIDYLGTRKQFGRPIGSFQVIQHRMADVAIEIEQARSAVVNLAGSVDGERDARERHVSACKELVGRVAEQVAEESIQLHGGIGLTEEYALGHLAKRLVLVDHRFGDSMHHLERYIALAVA